MKTLILTDKEAGLVSLLMAASMAVIIGKHQLALGIWARADKVEDEVWEAVSSKISAAGMSGDNVEQLLSADTDILLVQ